MRRPKVVCRLTKHTNCMLIREASMKKNKDRHDPRVGAQLQTHPRLPPGHVIHAADDDAVIGKTNVPRTRKEKE